MNILEIDYKKLDQESKKIVNINRQVEYEIKDFVGVFKKAFTEEYCEAAIRQYEHLVACGHGVSRQNGEGAKKNVKNDLQIFAHEFEIGFPLQQLQSDFNYFFWQFWYPTYAKEYPQLLDSDPHGNYAYKMQKTAIGEGYHVWHYESSARNSCNRLLTWILYLNDVEEGGETELLYQHRRIKPEAGTFLIFPSAFTHTHRGNPPLSNNKYIVTGWTEF